MTSLRMIGCTLLGILACVLPSIGLAASKASRVPVTPIRHLIVIVGENRTFDNVFGGYRPSRGQTVLNLLSEGIINADGTPGPNFIKTQQWQASDTDKYSIAPHRTELFKSLRNQTRPTHSGTHRAFLTRGFRSFCPTDLSRSAAILRTNSHSPATQSIGSFRCGNSSMGPQRPLPMGRYNYRDGWRRTASAVPALRPEHTPRRCLDGILQHRRGGCARV
jgi:hypothetical protein